MSRPRHARTVGISLLGSACLLLAASRAAAQAPPPPIGPFVIDARVSVPVYPSDDTLAITLGESPGTLPGHGLGFTIGGHWYPFRWKAITFGIGGELFRSKGSREPTPEEFMAATTPPPTIETRLRAFSPQISFNFGSGVGWSYVSGGMGRATLSIREAGPPSLEPDLSATTINYGGGARWFDREHVAFTLDLRIFAMSPVFDEEQALVLPRTTAVILNFGVAFK